MIDGGKRSKTLSEVKSVKNINKNLQSFLEISPVQKEVLLSHKLRDYAYKYQNPFRLNEDNLSQRNYQNQLSHPGLSHTEQEQKRTGAYIVIPKEILDFKYVSKE